MLKSIGGSSRILMILNSVKDAQARAAGFKFRNVSLYARSQAYRQMSPWCH